MRPLEALGMDIIYTITDTRLGRLLVASSAKGLCMVSIGKSDADLERKIHDQFPSESVRRDDRAMRAVAQACGANPVAVVVPCHRVVASAGQLGGYGLGLDRKIAILAAEGVSNPKWSADG